MPAAGTAEEPTASDRMTMSNIRRLAVSSASSWMPPTNGRKNRSIMRSLKPSPRSASLVDMSSPRSSSRGSLVRSRNSSRARRALSASVPIGATAEESTAVGWRSGSPTRCRDPSHHTIAPGSKRRRCSASRSSWRCSSGYAVNSTWKPRSRWNPSTWSVRTRPPMPSDASSTSTERPPRSSLAAAASPASPAPTITTSNRCDDMGGTYPDARGGLRAEPTGPLARARSPRDPGRLV